MINLNYTELEWMANEALSSLKEQEQEINQYLEGRNNLTDFDTILAKRGKEITAFIEKIEQGREAGFEIVTVL